MVRTLLTMALVAGVAGGSAAQAATAWQVGNNSYVIRLQSADVADQAGRAALLRVVERAASRLCSRAATRRAAERCAAASLASATRDLPRAVRQAIELARVERETVQLVAR